MKNSILSAMLTSSLLLGCSNLGDKVRVTRFPEDNKEPLALRMLKDEEMRMFGKIDSREVARINHFLYEADKKVVKREGYDEVEAIGILKSIHSLVKSNLIKNTYSVNEAIKTPFYFSGIKNEKGHCMHHTIDYVSVGELKDLPMLVGYAPTYKIGTNTAYGHVFVRFYLKDKLPSGENYINWECISGERKPRDYYQEYNEKPRPFTILSKEEFSNFIRGLSRTNVNRIKNGYSL